MKMINKIKSLLQNAPTNTASQVSTSSETSSAKIATSDKNNSGNKDVSIEASPTLATACSENKIRAKVNPEVSAVSIEIPVSEIQFVNTPMTCFG